MSCKSCQHIPMPIRLPKDLKAALEKMSLLIEAGKFSSLGYAPDARDFEYIARTHNWGDCVEVYFSCNVCGQNYVMYADAYHGRGGKLMPVDKLHPRLIRDERHPV